MRTRLTLRDLPYDDLRQGSVLDLPFAEHSFDTVFSHGVLHHVPEIEAQREIHRVLRPGGELVIMMYARWSLNYLVSIGLIRRAALLAAFPLARAGILKSDPAGGMLAAHLGNAEKAGCSATCGWRSSPITTPTVRLTRMPWCTTGGGLNRISRPSGSCGRTSVSCTRRRFPYTGCPARALWAGICGPTCNYGRR